MLKNHSLLDSIHLAGLSRTRIYLLYSDKDDTWWSKFLKKGYKHVLAVKFDGIFWIKMDYTLGWTDCDVLLYDNKDTIKDVAKGYKTQYVEVWRRQRYRRLFAPHSCVEMMKSLLGIRAWWILTPYQLYKYCEAHHGK